MKVAFVLLALCGCSAAYMNISQPASKSDSGLTPHGTAPLPGRISLDVKTVPFSSYDANLISRVQNRWYHLFHATKRLPESGKVAIDFRLVYDGRVELLTVTESEVPEELAMLCRRAITDQAPYSRWPDAMRRMVGAATRQMVLTFYYNHRELTPEERTARINKMRLEDEELERQRIAERLAEKEAALAPKRKYVAEHPELSEHFRTNILKGSAVIGMRTNDVEAACGTPRRKNVSVYRFGVHEQWVYGNDTYLYFEDSKLTSWSQSR